MNYYLKNEQDLRQNFEDYDMHQLQPTPVLMIVSYLSQGNFHALSQEWIVSDQINKTAERNALVAFTQDEVDDPSAMKDLARIMQIGIKFKKKKITIGRGLIASYNTMREQSDFCNNLHNKVIRNEVTKALALERIDDLVRSIEDLGSFN